MLGCRDAVITLRLLKSLPVATTADLCYYIVGALFWIIGLKSGECGCGMQAEDYYSSFG